MRVNLYVVFGLLVLFVLTMLSELCGGDYTVTRGTTIQSRRPIAWLVFESGWGVLNGSISGQDWSGLMSRLRSGSGAIAGVEGFKTTLCIDGVGRAGEGAGSHLGGMAKAAWRLIGFVFWDAPGSISRITDCQFRGHRVRIVDTVENGRVWVRVTIGPPLGDRRVRCAVLELTGIETKHGNANRTGTRLVLSCSAEIDLPGDRCRLVRRLSRRIAEQEAGPELSSRVNGLADVGRSAVLAGRGQLTEIIDGFVREVCHD